MTEKEVEKKLSSLFGDDSDVCFSSEFCLSVARSCAAYNLRRASRLVTQAFDQALKPSGLKITQFSLLVAFLLSPESNLAQLAKGLGMDRTTLSRNLRLLEDNGLVRTTPGEDRREQKVEITSQGKTAVLQAMPLWHKAQDRVVGILGEEKWAAMAKDLRIMASNLK
ncbi:MAG: MarR family winged helix-turn-helix transcriptional regulator [Desulfarculaceae bacterium]|nr:MarR family winged helix-turn-helix transcriptional regulator [Desulfarculaceae bacterium]MCF8072876.1 MarR family winged helix-turn-helix transcriptional regulator [Desulfarculaceae bacterium]MCF8101044.1 MarR family winged helix-turn-helix transcriptional regulator [Desulfarculaceae bacterium]MCF8115569.1 MarR family winged helix-turn-helix transcriptional regulator [Desulfarculaceae bacterium]